MAETTSRPVQIEGSAIAADTTTPTASSTTQSQPTASTASTDAAATTETQPLNLLTFHPNGSQVFLETITTTDQATVITGTFINGYTWAQTLSGEMTLMAEGFSLDSDWEEQIVPEAGSSDFSLRFPPLTASTRTFELLFNGKDAESLTSDSAHRPSFAIMVDLDGSAISGVLPTDRALDDSTTSIADTVMRITGLSFSPTAIGFDIDVRTVRDNGVSLRSTARSTYAIDDMGNQYHLVDQASNTALRIERFESLSGRLVLSGRVHPAAKELSLVINADSDPLNKFSSRPFLLAGPYLLDDTAAPSALPSVDGLPMVHQHANGTQIAVQSVEFGEASTVIGIQVDVEGSRTVKLNVNDRTALLDDQGNRYPMSPNAKNPDIELEAGSSGVVAMSFMGRIDPTARELALHINDQSDEYVQSATTGFPGFSFERVQLVSQGSVTADIDALTSSTNLVVKSFLERTMVG